MAKTIGITENNDYLKNKVKKLEDEIYKLKTDKDFENGFSNEISRLAKLVEVKQEAIDWYKKANEELKAKLVAKDKAMNELHQKLDFVDKLTLVGDTIDSLSDKEKAKFEQLGGMKYLKNRLRQVKLNKDN